MALPIAMAAAMAAQAAGSLISGFSSYQQSRSISEAHRRNADMALRVGGQREAAMRRQHARQLGTLRAAYAASGVTAEGSPAAVMVDQAFEAEVRSMMQRFESERTAAGQRFAARQARQQGQAALLGGALGAVSPGARGVAQLGRRGGGGESSTLGGGGFPVASPGPPIGRPGPF